jgi:hypothetical protein
MALHTGDIAATAVQAVALRLVTTLTTARAVAGDTGVGIGLETDAFDVATAGSQSPEGPGTLYPILRRMQENGYLQSNKELVNGKIRKTYRTTPSGDQALENGKTRVKELFGELFEED